MMNESTRTAAAGSQPAKPAAVTGEPRVDEALGRLAELGELPDAGHVEAYEHVYARLHGLLDELDTARPHPASQAVSHAVSHDLGASDGQAEQA